MKSKLKSVSNINIFIYTLLIVFLCFFSFKSFKYINILGCEKSVLSANDVTLNSMKMLSENTYVATDNDSQIIIDANCKMGILSFAMKTELYTGDIVVYYTTTDGDFSIKDRTWAKLSYDNHYTIDFGGKYISKIRIDPTTIGGSVLEFGDFVLNDSISLIEYIKPTYFDIFCIGIISVILYSTLDILKKQL